MLNPAALVGLQMERICSNACFHVTLACTPKYQFLTLCPSFPSAKSVIQTVTETEEEREQSQRKKEKKRKRPEVVFVSPQ